MKANYREFQGASFDAENVIDSSEISIYLDGDTPEEILQSAIDAQTSTTNWSDVSIDALWVRYAKVPSYWANNGADIIRATKETALLIISNKINA